MIEPKALYDERLQNYQKTFRLEQPDYVPIIYPFTPEFAVEYAGYSWHEGLWDMEILAKAMEKTFQDFEFDVVRSTFFRSPFYYKVLGAKSYVPSAEGFMQHPEKSSMEAHEYPELIAEPIKFLMEKALPRLYGAFDKPAPYNALAFTKAFMVNNANFAKFGGLMNGLMQQYSHPLISVNSFAAPMDFLADLLRGFSGISADVRRQPDNIIEGCEAVYPILLQKAMSKPAGIDKTVFIPLHMPAFMRTKDFEKLYWPSFKRMVEELIDNGHYLFIFFEGEWTRYFDYLQQLPKGKVLAWMEYGDMQQAKEKLKDVTCIHGYYPLTLLTTGNKQQCIDKAKEVLEIMAPGGGYMFGFDKIPTSIKDVKVENLRAVLEYVRANGKY